MRPTRIIYSFNDALLPLAVEKQMGIIGMKIPARGRMLPRWTPPPIEQQKHIVGRHGDPDARRAS